MPFIQTAIKFMCIYCSKCVVSEKNDRFRFWLADLRLAVVEGYDVLLFSFPLLGDRLGADTPIYPCVGEHPGREQASSV